MQLFVFLQGQKAMEKEGQPCDGEELNLIVITPNSNTFSNWSKPRQGSWVKTH